MPGHVFTNVLLADEINRTPPRTQAALLEAMQERTSRSRAACHRLPDPFLVIATQNPFEHEGVFPLPESQLDRFLFKIVHRLRDAEQRGRDAAAAAHRRDAGHARRDQAAARHRRPRQGPRRARRDRSCPRRSPATSSASCAGRARFRASMLGASSRAAIHLISAAKANARLEGRDTVTIDDVREMAPYVLRHRLICEDAAADARRRRSTIALADADPLGSDGVPGDRPPTALGCVSASACSSARGASTRARCARNSDDAARGRSAARCPRPTGAAASADDGAARKGLLGRLRPERRPAHVRRAPIEAPATEPLSRWTSAATPTVAQSCARRLYLT